jgi:Tat protein translocase TatB subunit
MAQKPLTAMWRQAIDIGDGKPAGRRGKVMFNIGMPELIIIAVVALFVVGPKRLPDLARSLGKGFQEFKKAAEDMTDSIKENIKTDEINKDMNDFKDSILHGTDPESGTAQQQGSASGTDKNHNDTPPALPH